MEFLVNEMLVCKDVAIIEQYYNVLDINFMKHPPCAQYMDTEYEQLLLGSHRKYFGEMTVGLYNRTLGSDHLWISCIIW